MIWTGDKYKDKAGNVYLIKDVKKRDNFLYHSQMEGNQQISSRTHPCSRGWECLVECLEGDNKGIEKWIDYNFLNSCLGENSILEPWFKEGVHNDN